MWTLTFQGRTLVLDVFWQDRRNWFFSFIASRSQDFWIDRYGGILTFFFTYFFFDFGNKIRNTWIVSFAGAFTATTLAIAWGPFWPITKAWTWWTLAGFAFRCIATTFLIFFGNTFRAIAFTITEHLTEFKSKIKILNIRNNSPELITFGIAFRPFAPWTWFTDFRFTTWFSFNFWWSWIAVNIGQTWIWLDSFSVTRVTWTIAWTPFFPFTRTTAFWSIACFAFLKFIWTVTVFWSRCWKSWWADAFSEIMCMLSNFQLSSK